MGMIAELKETIKMEIRIDTQGTEYFEAVFDKDNYGALHTILQNHLGPAAKEPGNPSNLPKEIQKIVDSIGGLRIEQSFFCKKIDAKIYYAALWPWQSNPEKITLKTGIYIAGA